MVALAFLAAGISIDRAEAVAPPTNVGLVDPSQGQWHLRDVAGIVKSFFFGNPGDFPITGDWDCDGIDTPGMYRQSDGFVYLSNANRSQIADIRFFFGNPGDVPLAGDFDGDGCDTVSIYRPTEGRFFIINKLGQNEGGLGTADLTYLFGNPGDKPFVGDFDGDGVETVGLHRESTGLVYFRQTHTQGIADSQFIYGDPGDRLVAGDWNSNGSDSPALFRPMDATFYFRYTNTQGTADDVFAFGESTWLPVAGDFGVLPGGNGPPGCSLQPVLVADVAAPNATGFIGGREQLLASDQAFFTKNSIYDLLGHKIDEHEAISGVANDGAIVAWQDNDVLLVGDPILSQYEQVATSGTLGTASATVLDDVLAVTVVKQFLDYSIELFDLQGRPLGTIPNGESVVRTGSTLFVHLRDSTLGQFSIDGTQIIPTVAGVADVREVFTVSQHAWVQGFRPSSDVPVWVLDADAQVVAEFNILSGSTQVFGDYAITRTNAGRSTVRAADGSALGELPQIDDLIGQSIAGGYVYRWRGGTVGPLRTAYVDVHALDGSLVTTLGPWFKVGFVVQFQDFVAIGTDGPVGGIAGRVELFLPPFNRIGSLPLPDDVYSVRRLVASGAHGAALYETDGFVEDVFGDWQRVRFFDIPGCP